MQSIGQHLQTFTRNGGVSKSVNNSRVGRKTPNKERKKQNVYLHISNYADHRATCNCTYRTMMTYRKTCTCTDLMVLTDPMVLTYRTTCTCTDLMVLTYRKTCTCTDLMVLTYRTTCTCTDLMVLTYRTTCTCTDQTILTKITTCTCLDPMVSTLALTYRHSCTEKGPRHVQGVHHLVGTDVKNLDVPVIKSS